MLAGAAHGAHIHAQRNVSVHHDGPGIAGEKKILIILFTQCHSNTLSAAPSAEHVMCWPLIIVAAGNLTQGDRS